MKLHELYSPPGARALPKRKGRGHGTGNGKTAGRGSKGQKARAGGGTRPGFEGGQMPLYRRVPKRGFHNIWAVEYAHVNVGALNAFEDGETVGFEELRGRGLVKRELGGVVVLGGGELSRKLTVTAKRFSASARQKIEQAGGKAEVV
jgi:large subunit ribosomal protein L15